MPAAKVSLRDALGILARFGSSTLRVTNGPTCVSLRGAPTFEESGPDLVIKVGCACDARVQRDRLCHVVFGQKPGGEGQLQVFDGNYEKVVAFTFTDSAAQMEKLAAEFDGNDFEIAG